MIRLVRRRLQRLRRDHRGVTAVEFALVAPVLIFMIVAVTQFGVLFYAHAALRNAVSEGARYATIYPRPAAADVITRINANRAIQNGTFSTPTVVYQQDATTGYWQATISMTYTTNLNFLLFTWPNVTLSYTRRAYVQAS